MPSSVAPTEIESSDQDEKLLQVLEHDESYQVLLTLAKNERGSTEVVLRADSDQLYVRKRINRELASLEAWKRISGIQSPNLPKIFDMYALPDQLVVVREYVSGSTLRDEVARNGALAPARACEIASDVCRAAAALHSVGVIHRDITPGNVICSSYGAVLIDLGIARAHEKNAASDTTHLGTWGFAAPEQFGFAQTDARSDVYSIGRLLGYMISGVDPSDSEFFSALEGEGIPKELRDVVHKATSFEPSSRYGDASEMLAALTAASSHLQEAIAPNRRKIHQRRNLGAVLHEWLELPRPSAFGKAFGKASRPRKIGSIATLAAGVLFSAVFAISGIVSFANMLQGLYQPEALLMIFITGFAIAMLCWACACALVRAGGYAQVRAVFRLLKTTGCLLILYGFAWIIMTAISAIRMLLM